MTTERRDRIADTPTGRSLFGDELRYFTNMVYLLFGGSFLGISLLLVSGEITGSASDYLAVAGGICIAIAFGRKRPRAFVAAYLGATVGGLAALAALRGLAALAGNGSYGSDKFEWSFVNTENYLVFGILWLLLGVPHRAFKYQLDQNGEGEAQHTLLGLVTAGAAILTSVSILILHFGGGPLHELDLKPLLAGIIFTVFLVLPGYRSLATACWGRGVHKIVRPKLAVKNWQETAAELDTALYRYFKNRNTASLDSEIYTQNDDNPRQQKSGGPASPSSATSTQAGKKAKATDETSRNAPPRDSNSKASPRRKTSKRSRRRPNARRH